jgi:hypothetical protein
LRQVADTFHYTLPEDSQKRMSRRDDQQHDPRYDSLIRLALTVKAKISISFELPDSACDESAHRLMAAVASIFGILQNLHAKGHLSEIYFTKVHRPEPALQTLSPNYDDDDQYYYQPTETVRVQVPLMNWEAHLMGLVEVTDWYGAVLDMGRQRQAWYTQRAEENL